MIEKIFPRKLNSDKDVRMLSVDEMVDAINVSVSNSFGSADSTDGEGVLKPTRGNKAISDFTNDSSFTGTATDRRVLGTVSDESLNVVYFFVWSNVASEQGVYAFDPEGVLPNSTLNAINYRKVFTSSWFAFPSTGFVKGNVVHTGTRFDGGGKSYDKKTILYFTDGVNEPRKLDVFRAMTSATNAYADDDVLDFITACSRTPLEPITFWFDRDTRAEDAGTPINTTSGFAGVPGFQFAYQTLYKSGEESAISTYSSLAVPPSYIQQGTQSTANILSHNKCVLKIPTYSYYANAVPNISKDIEKVRILARKGNTGDFFVIEEVAVPADLSTPLLYSFYNDRVITGVPKEEVLKQYNSLPPVASTQTVIGDRLVYADYTEGFDEVETDSVGTPVFKERTEDFLTYKLDAVPWINGMDVAQQQYPNPSQRSAGYKINTGELPDAIAAGTVIYFSLDVAPVRNWHFYDSDNSFHGTRQFEGEQNGATIVQQNASTGGSMADQATISSGRQYFGKNHGVNPPTALATASSVQLGGAVWKTTQTIGGGSVETDVAYGTSAANPFILQGKTLSFKIDLKIVTEITSGARLIIRDALLNAISESSMGSNVSVQYISNSSGYNINLNLNDTDEILTKNGSDSRKHLVVSVGDIVATDSGNTKDLAPCGYFIVDKADVKFKLRAHPLSVNSLLTNENDLFVSIELESLTNVSTKTCIPVFDKSARSVSGLFSVAPDPATWLTPEEQSNLFDGFHLEKYLVYSESVLISTDLTPTGGALSDLSSIFTPQADIPSFIDFEDMSQGVQALIQNPVIAYYLDNSTSRTRVAGYLSTSSLIKTTAEINLSQDSFTEQQKSFSGWTLLDGEAGPGWSSAFGYNSSYGSVSGLAMWTGWIASYALQHLSGLGAAINIYLQPTLLPGYVNSTIQQSSEIGFTNGSFNMSYVLDVGNGLTESWVEVLNLSSWASIGGEDLVNSSSFKTRSSHDFGIVYYDQRGRSSFVNQLESVYVPGYSTAERGPNKGRVSINMQLNHAPPLWARKYQIVYAGSSSVDSFIQYTVGGAYASTDSSLNNDGSLFISLNYLQGHSSASYAEGFGAVNNSGGKELYTYTEGDKLRIISYYIDPSLKLYPQGWDFDVMGVKNFNANPDENPFYDANIDGVAPHASKVGQFLMLKNNASATGFSLSEVVSSGNEFLNPSHLWNNIAVVEIISTSNSLSPGERVYHEVSSVYNVATNASGAIIHQTNPIDLTKGDVWWRRVPVNIPEWHNTALHYKNIISTDSSSPRLRDYYLESSSFNDTFAGTHVAHWGKPKFVFPGAKKTRKRASVIYSDKNNYSSKYLTFTSFNVSKVNFKDLPNEYGAINSILNNYDHIFVIQEDKCSAVPVNRSIISDASGGQSLITSSKVLGTQRFYAGLNGCDNNQESVTKAGENIYFANKSRREVYRFNASTGVKIISALGKKGFFNNLFKSVVAENTLETDRTRIVGGYNALDDEFVLSVHKTSTADSVIVGSDAGNGNPVILQGGGGSDFVIPPNLSAVTENTEATETFTSAGGGGGGAAIEELAIALETASNTITTLSQTIVGLNADIATASSDLDSLVAFLDSINNTTSTVYGTTITNVSLPNGSTIDVTSYGQLVAELQALITDATINVNTLQDDKLSSDIALAGLYGVYYNTSTSNRDLIFSFIAILTQLELTSEVDKLTTEITTLNNILNNVTTSSITATFSNGSTQTYTNYSSIVNPMWTEDILSSMNTISTLAVGGTNISGFSTLVTEAVAAIQTTESSLETQMRNMIWSLLNMKDAQGGSVFDTTSLPAELITFYQGAGLEGLDINADGTFDATEIITQTSIQTSLEASLQTFVLSLGNSVLAQILTAVNDTNVTTTAGVVDYINLLEANAGENTGTINNLLTQNGLINADLTFLRNLFNQLYLGLGVHGYSPVYVDSNSFNSQVYIDAASETELSALKTAIIRAMTELSDFQNLFAGPNEAAGFEGSYTWGAINNTRTVDATSIESVNISALDGVKEAITLINTNYLSQNPNTPAYNVASNYIPADILNALTSGTMTGPTTLAEYASQVGVSQVEMQNLKRALTATGAPNKAIWKLLFADTNDDNTIGAADLINFLPFIGQNFTPTTTNETATI